MEWWDENEGSWQSFPLRLDLVLRVGHGQAWSCVIGKGENQVQGAAGFRSWEDLYLYLHLYLVFKFHCIQGQLLQLCLLCIYICLIIIATFLQEEREYLDVP